MTIVWVLWLLLPEYWRGVKLRYRLRMKARKGSVRWQRKPQWVVNKVVRLKALMPDSGCRKIADAFNRQHQPAMTVSRTWVSDTLRKHAYEVRVLRRKIKHRVPRPVPINRVWGFDLTGKQDVQGNLHRIAGVIDHGSRRCLTLQRIRTKASVALVRLICDAVECYDKPYAIRTDNESVMTSRVFRWSLKVMGIRHQRTDRHCPWQNGRIERLFGTLKEKLNRVVIAHAGQLDAMLGEFKGWYNAVRTHQHLAGRTPLEVWCNRKPMRKAIYVQAWDGLLTGFYHPLR